MKSIQTSPIFMELTESQEASISGGSTNVNSITVTQTNGNVNTKTIQYQSGTNGTSTSTVILSNSTTDTKVLEKEVADFEKEFFKLDFDW